MDVTDGFVQLDRGNLDIGIVHACPTSRIAFAAGAAFLVGAASAVMVVAVVIVRAVRR